MGVTGRPKLPKPKPGAKTSDEYGLRSRTSVGKSPVSAQKRNDEFLTPSISKLPFDKAASSSSSFVCSVCQGAETLRNINLDKGIKNFCDEIEKLSSSTKTLQESNSDIKHICTALKHFIITFDSKTISNDFNKISSGIDTLSNNMEDLSNYVANSSVTREVLEKHHDEVKRSYADIAKTNSERFTSLSNEIELLKNYMAELVSSNTPTNLNNEPNKAAEEPFSVNVNGQRIINSSYALRDNPTTHLKSYKESVLEDNLKSNLVTFLSENVTFSGQDGKETVLYGKPLKYSKSRVNNATTEIPDILKNVISAIDPDKSQNLNSIIINKYSGENSMQTENRYCESSIKPESSIFSLVIGSQFELVFKDTVTGLETTEKVNNGSCLEMSQQSQFYWTHKMKCLAPESEKCLFTINFFSTGRNQNSTIVVGDSNTYNIKFHGERSYSNLGKEISGKRYTCYLIDEVDTMKCLGYRNIIFHIGINNLKDRRHSSNGVGGHVDINAVFDSWLMKVVKLRSLCPYSQIIVSPILPTQIKVLNSRAIAFNRFLFTCINKFWRELDFNSFLSPNELLDDNFARRTNVNTGVKDRIHLGRLGVARLGLLFRDAILGRGFSGRVNGRLYTDVLKVSGNTNAS